MKFRGLRFFIGDSGDTDPHSGHIDPIAVKLSRQFARNENITQRQDAKTLDKRALIKIHKYL